MFRGAWNGLAKAINWRLAGSGEKSTQKHRSLRALYEARFRWRTWVVQSVLTAPNFASHLRYIFESRSVGSNWITSHLLRHRNDSTSTSFSTFCHDWVIFGSQAA